MWWLRNIEIALDGTHFWFSFIWNTHLYFLEKCLWIDESKFKTCIVPVWQKRSGETRYDGIVQTSLHYHSTSLEFRRLNKKVVIRIHTLEFTFSNYDYNSTSYDRKSKNLVTCHRAFCVLSKHTKFQSRRFHNKAIWKFNIFSVHVLGHMTGVEKMKNENLTERVTNVLHQPNRFQIIGPVIWRSNL